MLRQPDQLLEDERYCMDVFNQIQAVKAALAKVEDAVLKDHAALCVAAAIDSGNQEEQTEKFAELVDLFACAKRG